MLNTRFSAPLLPKPHIRKVSLWLGHAHMQTTEIYLRADPTEKIEAIEGIMPMSLRRGKFTAPDKLIASLQET